MATSDYNDIKLLSEFIDQYQRYVSIICEDRTEQDTINNTFQNAYNCLLDFIEKHYPDLELVITPLSTSLLGSYSKGIMIPDVPIGIIVNSKNNRYNEIQKNHLHNILCYIGIINILKDVSLSRIIKNLSKEDPTRLYGYINFDGCHTTLHGLTEDENDNDIDNREHSINWDERSNSIILNEISEIYSNVEGYIPNQYQEQPQFHNPDYNITPREYDQIKNLILKKHNLTVTEENKKIIVCASHRKLCEKTGLCTSYYFFNQPLIKDKSTGKYLNYGNIVITVNRELTYVWEKILSFFSLQILSAYRVYFQQKIESELLRSNQKSAIAAIMSRNMSHNLGSHFISNTKNYFSSLIESDPNNRENYRGIKHSLQYIQERMDFIATITSTDTYPFGAVNAKAQIFDELTPDDFGNRHGQKSYNFLMDYLVLSEKISKQSRGDNQSLSKLILQFGHWDGKGNPVFWDPRRKNKDGKEDVVENQKRDEILGIYFAIPGGILGRHAVFSIIENIIRNAAKHGQEKIQGDFIVRMLYRTDEQRLIVFDNKNDGDIKGTVEKLNKKLKEMHFLTPEGALEQDSKGLKEMLICAIWLQNEDVSQVMTDNDSKNEEDRLENFSKYLKVVAVDENGKELEANDTNGFLGYSIKLDQYERVHYLKKEELTPDCLRNIKADVVCYKEDCEIGKKKLSEIFPRFLVESSDNDMKDKDDVEVLRQVVKDNCGTEALQRKMVVSYTTKFNYKNKSDVTLYENRNLNCMDFLFKEHAGKSKWDKFNALFLTKGFEDKYVDAISGGDFTYTLVQPSFVDDDYNLLKIKESVATCFVLIDERIFEHYKPKVTMTCTRGKEIKEGLDYLKSKYSADELCKNGAYNIFSERMAIGNGIYEGHESELEEFLKNSTLVDSFLEKDLEQHYLERRGIYVFNLESDNKGFKMVDLSSNEKEFLWKKDVEKFDCDDKRFETKNAIFLSVHLGLIDKIKDQFLRNGENIVNGDTIDKEIVEALRLYFGAKFVSIHSGRGGFDIRESLRQYAFQSFSAIENPLYNSKFLLAQQFYTLKYYGTSKN